MTSVKVGDKVKILQVGPNDTIHNARIGSIATVVAQDAVSKLFILHYVADYGNWCVGGAEPSSLGRLAPEDYPIDPGTFVVITNITENDFLIDAEIGMTAEVISDFDGECYEVAYYDMEDDPVIGYATPGSVKQIEIFGKQEEEIEVKPKKVPVDIQRKVLLAEQDDNLAWLFEALADGDVEKADKAKDRLREINVELEELK